MADLLLLLGKLNVAVGAAIIVVYLLRRPLRALFGASIAYAIWLLVPIASLAVLLPPRVVALPPVHLTTAQPPFASISVIGRIPSPLGRITEQIAGQGVFLHPLIAAHATAPAFAVPNYITLIFAAWILGAALMALFLAELQARFHAAVRLGEAGPAVVGFFRPRIVIPDTFQEQFTAPEQAAILAHEHIHLTRQDARINALAALLRCLCWMNPLVHLGATWLRIDQELACDATTIAGPVLRRDYANALLKSQMIAAVLPLGCNWRGSQHPLVERIALLKCNPPTIARRITGTSIVMLATASMGLTAWAAQPPVAAKPVAGPKFGTQIATNETPAVIVSTADVQGAGGADPKQPVLSPSTRGPLLSAHRVSRLLQTALVVHSQDLSRLFKETLLLPQLIATAEAAPTTAQPVPNTPPLDQPPSNTAATAQTVAAPTCNLPKIADAVPLEPLPGTNLVTVPVGINGTTKRFLLDIGINKPTEISPATKAELGLPENLPLTQAGIKVPVYDVVSGLGSWVRDTHLRISSFAVGDATARHLQFMEAKKGEIAQGAPYAGFLTGDFFRQYDVELNFAEKQITWLTPTKCTDPNQVIFWPHSEVAIIPVTLARDGRLQMQAMIQGHLINAEIDTSSQHSVMRRDIAELYVGLKADKDMLPVGDLEDGMRMQVYVHTFPQIIFAGGGITALNVPVFIQDYSMRRDIDQQSVLGARGEFDRDRIPDLVIGMDVLQHLHMYVVPGQGRVYVTSAG